MDQRGDTAKPLSPEVFSYPSHHFLNQHAFYRHGVGSFGEFAGHSQPKCCKPFGLNCRLVLFSRGRPLGQIKDPSEVARRRGIGARLARFLVPNPMGAFPNRRRRRVQRLRRQRE